MTATKPDPASLADPVATLVGRLERHEIVGASDIARNAAEVINGLVSDPGTTDTESHRRLDSAVEAFARAAPAIVPLHRVLHLADLAASAGGAWRPAAALAMTGYLDDLAAAIERVTAVGAELVPDHGRVFVYSSSSTVYGIVERAARDGKSPSVVVTESRPGMEGLTAIRRFASTGIEVTVGIDAAIGQLVADADLVIVGADSVRADGGCLVKVGCLPTALVARHVGVPFYVAADRSKFDPASDGSPALIPELPASLVVEDPPAHVIVRNPYLEVVPGALITGIISDIGVLTQAGIRSALGSLPTSDRVSRLLASAGSAH